MIKRVEYHIYIKNKTIGLKFFKRQYNKNQYKCKYNYKHLKIIVFIFSKIYYII